MSSSATPTSVVENLATARGFADDLFALVQGSGLDAFRDYSSFNAHEKTLSLTSAKAGAVSRSLFPHGNAARDLAATPIEAFLYLPGFTGTEAAESGVATVDLSLVTKWAVGTAPSLENDEFTNIDVRMNTGEVVSISAWVAPDFPVIVVARGTIDGDPVSTSNSARGTRTTLYVDYVSYTFPQNTMDPFYEPLPEIYCHIVEGAMTAGTVTGGTTFSNVMNPAGTSLKSGSIYRTEDLTFTKRQVYVTDTNPTLITIQFRDRDGLVSNPSLKSGEKYVDDDMGQLLDLTLASLTNASTIYMTTSNLTDDNDQTTSSTIKTYFRLYQ